jgi:hypothetical protein
MAMRDDVWALQDELARTRRELKFAREELKVMRPQQTLNSNATATDRGAPGLHADC